MDIIKINPDGIGYQDRRIQKWFSNRMMLSDHLEKLKMMKDPKPLIENVIKEEQTAEVIENHLYYLCVCKSTTYLYSRLCSRSSRKLLSRDPLYCCRSIG